jgi:hypothetical protein
MYRFGIAYYEYIETVRTPITGLTVKLVIPGGNWGSGIVLTETPTGSGYYESATIEDPGLYEIWDDNGGQGANSGKTVQIGKIQTGDIVDNAIDGNKLGVGSVHDVNITDEQVTHAKVADNAIEENNIKNGAVTLEKLEPDVQLELEQIETGIGVLTGIVDELLETPIYYGVLDSPPVVIMPVCPISGRGYIEGDMYLIGEDGLYMAATCFRGDHIVYNGVSWERK